MARHATHHPFLRWSPEAAHAGSAWLDENDDDDDEADRVISGRGADAAAPVANDDDDDENDEDDRRSVAVASVSRPDSDADPPAAVVDGEVSELGPPGAPGPSDNDADGSGGGVKPVPTPDVKHVAAPESPGVDLPLPQLPRSPPLTSPDGGGRTENGAAPVPVSTASVSAEENDPPQPPESVWRRFPAEEEPQTKAVESVVSAAAKAAILAAMAAAAEMDELHQYGGKEKKKKSKKSEKEKEERPKEKKEKKEKRGKKKDDGPAQS